jgi:predicted ferric reductase
MSHKISRLLWIPLLTLIIGVPLASWLMHAIGQGYPLMTLVGRGTGIIGAQLFAFSLVLSVRHRFIEYFFGGLDKLYIIHHRVGVFAFVFLAVHPFALAAYMLDGSVEDLMMYLMPFGEASTYAKNFGIYALLAVFVLLFLTFYGMIFSYKTLKNAHRFMGAAFFLGFLHIFYTADSAATLRNDPVLLYSCLGMATLGILAFVYRTLLGSFLVPHFKYTVSAVETIGQGLFEITLSPVGKKFMKHLPGQFAMLTFKNSKIVPDEEHPFTLSSAPRENGDVRFSIKALGDWTSLLGGLIIGTKATLEGSFGEFYYGYGTKAQIWVAGGIGVTPFVAFTEDLLKQDSIDYTIDFYYSVRSEKDGAYKDLFDQLAKKHPSFHFHFMPSDVAGYVTGDGIVKELSDAKTRDIFVCGPPPMMAALTGSLVASGVSSHHIHSEKFSLLK